MIIDIFKRFFVKWIWCFAGLLLHLPVVVLHHPDDILPLSSAATAPHLCRHRRGGCPALPQNAPLPCQSDAPPGPPNAEVLPLKGDAHRHPPHLHPDTGGAPCCLQSGKAGTLGPLVQQQAASPPPLQTVVTLSEVPSVLRDVMDPAVHLHLTSGDSSLLPTVANLFAECPAPQSHATTRGKQGSWHVKQCIICSIFLYAIHIRHHPFKCYFDFHRSYASPQPMRRASSRSVSPQPTAQKRPVPASASPSPSRSASGSPPPAKKASSGSGSQSPSKVCHFSFLTDKVVLR